MFVFGRLTTSIYARLLVIPNYVLATLIFVISLIGAYAARRMMMDVWIAIIAGVFGYFMKKLKFSHPAFVLAFVLGSLIEKNFRRSLMLSSGSYSIFVTRPLACACLLANVLLILFIVFKRIREKESGRVTACLFSSLQLQTAAGLFDIALHDHSRNILL